LPVFGDSKKEVYHIILPNNRAAVVNWELYNTAPVSVLSEYQAIIEPGSEGDLSFLRELFFLG
jgi:hypothetical protein